jgi:hypothetical protein
VRRNPLMFNLLKAKVKTTLNSKTPITTQTSFKDYFPLTLRIRKAIVMVKMALLLFEQSLFEYTSFIKKNAW